MDFKVEGTCNTKTYCQSPWFAAKKNFWILDALQWLKQPSNSFYFETLSFPFVSLSSFCHAKKAGGHALPHPPLRCRRPWLYTKRTPWNWVLRPWNVKMKYTNGYSSKSRWEKRSHLSSYHVYSGSFMVVIKMSKMVHFLYFLWITVKCLSSMFKCTWKILLISFRKW